MQEPTKRDSASLLAGVIEREIPSALGVQAWSALLRAHASLMRRLDSDLRARTGAGLNDWDVLAQLAGAGGSVRMTDLAERAYSSRSGMTRRVDHLVEEGLLCRSQDDADGRSVVVALTDAGVARLQELAPVHVRGIAELFVSRLDEKELSVLRDALAKVTVETTFG